MRRNNNYYKSAMPSFLKKKQAQQKINRINRVMPRKAILHLYKNALTNDEHAVYGSFSDKTEAIRENNDIHEGVIPVNYDVLEDYAHDNIGNMQIRRAVANTENLQDLESKYHLKPTSEGNIRKKHPQQKHHYQKRVRPSLTKVVTNLKAKKILNTKNGTFNVKNDKISAYDTKNYLIRQRNAIYNKGIKLLQNGDMTLKQSRKFDKRYATLDTSAKAIQFGQNSGRIILPDVSKTDLKSGNYAKRLTEHLKNYGLVKNHHFIGNELIHNVHIHKYNYTFKTVQKCLNEASRQGIQSVDRKAKAKMIKQMKPKKITSFTEAVKELGIQSPKQNGLQRNFKAHQSNYNVKKAHRKINPNHYSQNRHEVRNNAQTFD